MVKGKLKSKKLGRPRIPKFSRSKPCPVCGCNMSVYKEKKGSPYKRAKTYWECSDKTICKHTEINESPLDTYIRKGLYDDEIGILPFNNIEEL